MKIINNITDLTNVTLENDTIYQLGQLTEQMTIVDIDDPADTTVSNIISIMLTTSTILDPLIFNSSKINALDVVIKPSTKYEISLVYDTFANIWQPAIVGASISDVIVNFTEASSTTTINSGSTLGTILGIIKKWYTDIISKIGNPTTLATTNKTIVGGINEVRTSASNAANAAENAADAASNAQSTANTAQNAANTANNNANGRMPGRPTEIEFQPPSTASGYGGYIDFHYNQSAADYTSRIIEEVNGLRVYSSRNAQQNGTLVTSNMFAATHLVLTFSEGSCYIAWTSLGMPSGIHHAKVFITGSSSNNVYLSVNYDSSSGTNCRFIAKYLGDASNFTGSIRCSILVFRY